MSLYIYIYFLFKSNYLEKYVYFGHYRLFYQLCDIPFKYLFLNLIIISEKFPPIIVLVFILFIALVFFFKGLLYLYWIFIHQLLLNT